MKKSKILRVAENRMPEGWYIPGWEVPINESDFIIIKQINYPKQ